MENAEDGNIRQEEAMDHSANSGIAETEQSSGEDNKDVNTVTSSNDAKNIGEMQTDNPQLIFPIEAWFNQLSEEQRSAALGFLDGPFLKVFSRLATTSASSSSVHAVGDAIPTTDELLVFSDMVDWQADLRLIDVERAYADVNNSSDLISEAISRPADSISLELQTQEDSVDKSTEIKLSVMESPKPDQDRNGSKAGEGLLREVDSDAFRIQDEATQAGTLSAPADKVEQERDSNEEAKQEESMPTGASEKVASFMDNLCVTFPSAFKLVKSDATLGLYPYITIHSTFATDGESTILALDELMTICNCNNTFLASPTSLSWIELVRQTCSSHSPESSTIPLFMLILLRLQISVFESFQNYQSSSAQEGQSNSSSKVPSIDERNYQTKLEVQDSSPPSSTLPPSSSSDDAPVAALNVADSSTEETPESKETALLYATLHLSLKQRLELLAKETLPENSEILLPLSLCFQEFTDGTASLNEAFFMSMSLALKRLRGTDSNFDDSIRMIDQAIAETVGRIEKASIRLTSTLDHKANHKATPNATNSAISSALPSLGKGNDETRKDNEAADHDAGLDNANIAASPGSPGKRNTKKKKKKKKRKGMGVSPQGSSSKGNVLPEEKQSVEDAPAPKVEVVSDATEDTESNLDKKVEGQAVVTQVVSPDTAPSPTTTVSKTESSLAASSDTKIEDLQDVSGDDSSTVQVSRMEGVDTSSIIVGEQQKDGKQPSSSKEDKATEPVQSTEQQEDDHSTWETVEVRSRSNRKKNTDRNHHGRSQSGGQHSNSSKKSKTPRSKASRKRIEHRKMVRDILTSILDAVDDEVRKRRQSRSWREGPRAVPGTKWSDAVGKSKVAASTGKVTNGSQVKTPTPPHQKEASMRDVLIGRQNVTRKPKVSSGQKSYSDLVRNQSDANSSNAHRNGKANVDIKKKVGNQKLSLNPADQNTAPTVPETLSVAVRESGAARSDSSSVDSVEVAKPQGRLSQSSKEASPSPPLPTLLGPCNTNSATDSVASSLDAPHAGHRGGHYPNNENDVGCHLLGVCDRLTREIDIFMVRRADALKVRRHERGQVLNALQDTLSSIWPGMCNVEMYGSCATDLDLPSSDLDVVVRGLDGPFEPLAKQEEALNTPTGKEAEHEVIGNALDPGTENPSGPINALETHETLPQMSHASHAHMMYGHVSPNAERVVRLAMELERQPWAVHVKAIPTATVPVIKILADPARLQGAASSSNGEWLMHYPMSQQPPVVPPQGAGESVDGSSNQSGVTAYSNAQVGPVWRGADVVNGLLKLDITFEGPEHGGIGSTKFSTRVVNEFSVETGFPPDRTPFVQVLMVLKEVLAQRRLNEPFTGGLSSYALLLLLLSVVRERNIIREELERVERQRRLVTGGGDTQNSGVKANDSSTLKNDRTSSAVSARNNKTKNATQQGAKSVGPPNNATPPIKQGVAPKSKGVTKSEVKGKKQSPRQQGNVPTANNAAQGTIPSVKKAPSSSWASIAKKTTPTSTLKGSQDQNQSSSTQKGQPTNPTKVVSSFADAVAKGSLGGSTSKALTKESGPDTEKGSTKQKDSPTPAPATKPTGKVETQPKQNQIPKPTVPVVSKVKSQTTVEHAPPNKNESNSNQFDSSSAFPQTFHDVIEVLASGDLTPGKLLMHFLLFYGRHFDSQSTAIDCSQTHERDAKANNGYSVLSPYMQRRTAGTFDPMTGMLTVDPIVVYDPLEGSESKNVARSCFLWSSVRWVFAQSYMTLSSAVEMSAGNNPSQESTKGVPGAGNVVDNSVATTADGTTDTSWRGPFTTDESGNMAFDPSSPLLELLLSY